ncbi:MAG: hypothetical protein LBC44_00610 [Mycoplasmataceae bacterium]|jgi:hypothetical protein|nr:hypothetical protein [Mycoplasmataceae bacterium]
MKKEEIKKLVRQPRMAKTQVFCIRIGAKYGKQVVKLAKENNLTAGMILRRIIEEKLKEK